MIRATQVRPQVRWTEAAADTVVLGFDDRHRRRMAMTGTRGLEFLLDLQEAVALRGGDALVLEDGRLIEVVAAPEPLVEIRGTDPHHLVRVAWHLGNRHLPTQIVGKGLRIRRDHVIEEMVRGLGARSRYPLPAAEIDRFNGVCVGAIQDMLVHKHDSACQLLDPTGREALARAETLRRKLRVLKRRGQMPETIAAELNALGPRAA